MDTPRQSISLTPSAGPRVAADALLAELGDWIGQCIRELSDVPPNDVHDQGTYTIAWEPYIRATGEAAPLAFMRRLRDATKAHFDARGLWRHGYWRENEAHHGTEHYQLFLGALWRLDPSDAVTVAHVLDAAEHLGNWTPDAPAFFDWDTGLFRGFHFGMDGVPADPGNAINVTDHLRCVHIALLAHAMSGDRRYLDLAYAHTRRWADAIVDGPMLPAGLAPDGVRYALYKEEEETYLRRVGAAGSPTDDLKRAEQQLASWGVHAQLALWRHTGEARFRRAAERILDIVATQMPGADAGVGADAIRVYRRTTGDTRYDAAILDAVRAAEPLAVGEVAMDPAPTWPPFTGIGKRGDMPAWYFDGAPRGWHPVTLAVAAEIAGNDAWATWALDVARAQLVLARRVYPHGREHGCSARTVNAITAGHGREAGVGAITGVLGPLLECDLLRTSAPRA